MRIRHVSEIDSLIRLRIKFYGKKDFVKLSAVTMCSQKPHRYAYKMGEVSWLIVKGGQYRRYSLKNWEEILLDFKVLRHSRRDIWITQGMSASVCGILFDKSNCLGLINTSTDSTDRNMSLLVWHNLLK